MSTTTASRLKAELFARYSLMPSQQWLDDFMSTSSNPSHPLPALTSTAHFRLLATDFSSSLSTERGQAFSPNHLDVNTKEVSLTIDIPVQVLDIQDISTSNWSQIEAIERVERGEEIRGREVIRNVPGATENDDDSALASESGNQRTQAPYNQSGSSRKGSKGPHKLLLQDAAGTKIWAFELARIDRITIVNQNPPVPGSTDLQPVEGMQIGCKLILKKGTQVRRSLAMLTPSNTVVMGGKIDLWDKKWRESRKTRLAQNLNTEGDS